MKAKTEEQGCGIGLYADEGGFISVTPQGMNDNPSWGGPWYSWNAVGSTQSPGPAGPTCTKAASDPSYCYTSCKPCTDNPQCSWTTCDDVVTPTGTGTKNVNGFIPSLYDTLESQLCIDLTREYGAGESNGGMMTYQLGVDLSARLAAIAPQFGSFHMGFCESPAHPVPVIDIHGKKDKTVPANVSLSADGYYYTTTAEIFGGGKYCAGWKKSNGCDNRSYQWKTKWDGQDDLWCLSECSKGDVVRCSWSGGHNWYANNAQKNGGLVTTFLLQWTKTSHIGNGSTIGESPRMGNILESIEILERDPSIQSPFKGVQILEEDPPIQSSFEGFEKTLSSGSHYGNPVKGCLPDEDVVSAGNGRVCAPRIEADVTTAPPTPKCKIGGVVPQQNGCPLDATVVDGSKAFPTCLAKSNYTDIKPDPYTAGEFHCLLVCPCDGVGNAECGPEGDAHCPLGAKCQRGDLRHRAQGVCVYPMASERDEYVKHIEYI
eukprot:gnl/MRDRNA2_/MRDRNA2_63299_c0_seq2.p1 gnl/MRDRNA2_/MRDRNA2_63299_c0~~gnl/MRDRNA2_/MRDRNA2_63299_c0_seq2.p1  ORF type:complete len:538 (+),score=70.55 gnl/MRDRNA2_/MRDRNA2_63299_c0_seq2:153-1616(+)